MGLAVPTRALCCYPENSGFIAALADGVQSALQDWPAREAKRLLLSAHGLPKKIVAAGDPYQWQIERTAAALRAALADSTLESVVCYQSRVGPLAWLEPATDAEIRRAGAEKIGVVVVPIAFVSEHSETLVELDLDYRHLAESVGVPRYRRVPTVGVAAGFIAGLAALVRDARGGLCPAGGERLCPHELRKCLCAA